MAIYKTRLNGGIPVVRYRIRARITQQSERRQHDCFKYCPPAFLCSPSLFSIAHSSLLWLHWTTDFRVALHGRQRRTSAYNTNRERLSDHKISQVTIIESLNEDNPRALLAHWQVWRILSRSDLCLRQ